MVIEPFTTELHHRSVGLFFRSFTGCCREGGLWQPQSRRMPEVWESWFFHSAALACCLERLGHFTNPSPASCARHHCRAEPIRRLLTLPPLPSPRVRTRPTIGPGDEHARACSCGLLLWPAPVACSCGLSSYKMLLLSWLWGFTP